MSEQNYCWICKKIADSAEHRIKRSDLVALHGLGTYQGENSLLMFRDGKELPIQGPNSKIVKYKKILCSDCNNNFSKPFDKAYECFVAFILEHENIIVNRRFLDFREIYGNEFEDGQRNLYKYFVKSFGCRLADNNYSIPEDLRILLSKKRFRTRLRITFSVNEVFLEHKLNILSNGPLMTFFPSEESRPTWIEKWRYKKYGRMRPLEYICSENFK